MKKLLISVATLICLLTFSSLAFAQSINPDYFPTNQGFVTDEADVISAEDEAELNALLQNLQAEKQVEIAVVTVKTLHDYPIEEFTLELGRHWGVGQKDTNTGVVFLTAPNERLTRIEVGYGLEGDLTDLESFAITEDIIPYFRNNDYSQGIKFGTEQIIASLDGEYISQNTAANQSSTFESFLVLIYFVIFGLMWIASVLARSKSWYAGGAFGATSSAILSFFFQIGVLAIPAILICTIAGLFIDKAVSKAYQNTKKTPWWAGGGNHNNRSGGSFGGGSSSGGGFSGGSFGGGGSTGRW